MPHAEGQGTGRWGWLADPLPLGQLAERLKQFLAIERLQLVGARSKRFAPWRWRAARRANCSTPPGKTAATRWSWARPGFTPAWRPKPSGIGLLLPGHFASERFAVECLADVLARQFPDVQVWASRQEKDPVRGCEEWIEPGAWDRAKWQWPMDLGDLGQLPANPSITSP